MKTNSRPGYSGFTLIELMAVITIIVILAGLVVGGLRFVNDRQAKEKAKVQIALLSKALEEYKLDNGQYPLTNDTASGQGAFPTVNGVKKDLYVVLFYEGYEYSQANDIAKSSWPADKSTKIYLPDLDPTASKQGWVDPVTGTNVKPPATSKLKDPWGNEYRYRSAIKPAGTANGNTINPDFDLWSSGKDGTTTPANAAAVNSRDDIKNF